MQKKITLRGLDRSPVLEDHINKLLDKFDTLLQHEASPSFIDMVVDVLGHHHHRAEIRIKTPNYDLVSHYECQDLYRALDTVVDKMKQELAKAHERIVEERIRGKY